MSKPFERLCIAALLCLSGLVQAALPMAEGAKLKLVSDQFVFTEGPAADAAGNIYFTDQPNDKIWKYAVDGTLSLFMDDAGRSNGMAFDGEGNLLTCADEKGELWRVTPNGAVTVLVKDVAGKRLNGPNDLWVDPAGGIYFTDPYYQRPYWEHSAPELDKEAVYYLPPDAHEPLVVADDLVKPNGIIGSSDGRTLYVADIGDDKTYVYSVLANGQLSAKKQFTDMGSDGMALDQRGNLYLTGDGVTVFDRHGKRIGHIPVPGDWTANVTFGGENGRTLFITAGPAVYTLAMQVAGM